MGDVSEVNEPAGDFVQSLARGLEVIRSFDADHPVLSLSEVARRTGISPAAAGRFLRTLEALGYVRSDDRRFALTPKVLELGFSYLSALSLPEVMQPHLEQLSRLLDESVSAAVLNEDEIVYIARVPTRRIMSVRIMIGTRFPAAVTSMGRVLCAALPRDARVLSGSERAELAVVREQGYALADGELEPGLRSVAVPVRGRDGTVVAAVNIATSTSRVSLDEMRERFVPALLATAAAIEAELRLV